MSTLTQRNDTDFIVTVTDASDVAIDITGYGVEFLFARRRGETPVLTLGIGAGVVLSNPPAGELTASITDAQANLIGTYYIECITTDGSSNQKTVYSGYITFNPTSRA